MSEFIASFENGLMVDLTSLAVLGVLCIFGSYLIRERLDAAALGILCYPLLVGCTVLVYHSAQHLGVLNPKRLDDWFVWLLFSALLGMLVAFLLIWLMMLTWGALFDAALDRRQRRIAAARSK